MKELAVHELRAAMPTIEEMLAEEGEIRITRHGSAIARILPVGGVRDVPSHAALRKRQPRQDVGSEVLLGAERAGA